MLNAPASPLPDVRSASPTASDDAPARLAAIARASIDLGALGPQLARLAAEIEARAQAQARHAAEVAATTDALARDLAGAVAELRASSGQMHSALATVERIADHTRLLSVNASIEAARAGEAGRAFAVVVDEVKRLADTSAQSTHLIADRMQEIDVSVTRVASVAADSAAEPAGGRTVSAVNRDIRDIAGHAAAQLDTARSVHGLGGRINALTDLLLVTVGRFRFDAHARAREDADRLRPELAAAIGSRPQLERLLERWLGRHRYFELGYVTDVQGRQLVDNLVCRDGKITRDPAGLGRRWGERPWFRDALRARATVCSDLYRSSATDDFCFTVSTPLCDATGRIVGVFASDVNFQRLVAA
ncbi:MAG TPA: methyl-accepting chemotaxis protein [Opitutus sp.]|nr:methyl-accepting chemotaxis protein [Opitutus sp.]